MCGTYLKCEADREKHVEEKHRYVEDAKKCVYCGEWVRFMTQHVNNLHHHVAIKCSYSVGCYTFFRSESDRDEHVQKVHLVQKVAQKVDCIYCGKSYEKSCSYPNHVRNQHSEIAIKCGFVKCGQFFKSQEDCDDHFIKMHHEKEALKNIFCPKCDYKTDDRSCFLQHLKIMHGNDKLKCTRCEGSEATYRSIQALKHHILNTHRDGKICRHCNRSVNKYKLTEHLSKDVCSLCKIEYQCKGAMQDHKKWCRRKCKICLEIFSGEIRLLNHFRKVHKYVDIQKLAWLGDLRYLTKSVKCKQCKRCFYNTSALNHHSRVHEKKRTMYCDLCEVQFQLRSKLERHIISFHGFKK
jgi:hypothetical protein